MFYFEERRDCLKPLESQCSFVLTHLLSEKTVDDRHSYWLHWIFRWNLRKSICNSFQSFIRSNSLGIIGVTKKPTPTVWTEVENLWFEAGLMQKKVYGEMSRLKHFRLKWESFDSKLAMYTFRIESRYFWISVHQIPKGSYHKFVIRFQT